jgi:hypothetical protein
VDHGHHFDPTPMLDRPGGHLAAQETPFDRRATPRCSRAAGARYLQGRDRRPLAEGGGPFLKLTGGRIKKLPALDCLAGTRIVKVVRFDFVLTIPHRGYVTVGWPLPRVRNLTKNVRQRTMVILSCQAHEQNSFLVSTNPAGFNLLLTKAVHS